MELMEIRRRLLVMKKTKITVDIPLVDVGYIKLNSQPVDLVTHFSTTSYRSAVVDCRPGDSLTITGSTGNASAALLYAILDSDNMILNSVPFGYVADNLVVPVPDGGVKIVVNQRNSIGTVTATLTAWR